jgi:hypothetical protein
MIGNVLTQESIVLAVVGVTAHGIAQTTRREDCRDATTSRKGTAKKNNAPKPTAAITTASFDFKARRPARSTGANTACPGASHAVGE